MKLFQRLQIFPHPSCPSLSFSLPLSHSFFIPSFSPFLSSFILLSLLQDCKTRVLKLEKIIFIYCLVHFNFNHIFFFFLILFVIVSLSFPTPRIILFLAFQSLPLSFFMPKSFISLHDFLLSITKRNTGLTHTHTCRG